MATDQKFTPSFTPKTLLRRQNRGGKTLAVLAASEPGQSALRARRIAILFQEVAKDESRPMEERIGAAKTVLAAQAQMLDWLAIPKRPAAGSAGRNAIPIEAIEAILATPPADLPLDP
jgi:hypothetical protein